ncbi:MAG: radical SAM/SPASM domain-containing protein [Planctomycetota bacterium]
MRGKLSNLLLNETERIHHVKGVRSSPIYLRLDPSWACTLDCPFCHANLLKKRGFSRKEMNAGTFQNIMDRFGKDLIAARLGTWGEPFLNPAVTGYIRAMKEYGIHVSADSHLNHDWTDDDIGEIISSGLDLLVASIDGATQESYVRYRKGGSLDRALENVRTIVQKKREIRRETPRIRWQYLLFDWNEGEVEMARKLSEESGCDEFVAKRGDTFEPYTPFLEYRDNSFMDSMTPGIRERMTRFCKERNEKKEYFGCDLLYHQLVIHADGSIHPCAYVHEPRVLYGSVHLKKDVFNTAHYKNARRLFIQPPPQECQGYNPCLNCTVVTDDHHEGYVPGDMDFFSAFELLTGEKLNV